MYLNRCTQITLTPGIFYDISKYFFLCAVYKLTSAFEKLMYTEAGKTAATKDVDQVNIWSLRRH